jgi:aldose 1-epimerase
VEAGVGVPSGAQVELVHGSQRAVVVEVGGGLREYAVGDRPVLDGYGPGEMCGSGRGQTLIPWPNRLGGGRYTFAGQDHRLALTEPAKGNAIHGLTRWANWTVAERAADRATMAYRLHPQPGYPFQLDCTLEYALSDAGLAVRTTATNTGDDPCPYGTGAHPYLSPGRGTVDTVDTVSVRAPGTRYLPVDDAGLPTGVEDVAGTPYDLRAGRSLAGLVLDHCYTGLERDADGLARVELAGVRLWLDAGYPYLQLFTGDTIAPERRRQGLAVEPMTCPPDAFRSGEGLHVLEPGRTIATNWGIEV